MTESRTPAAKIFTPHSDRRGCKFERIRGLDEKIKTTKSTRKNSVACFLPRVPPSPNFSFVSCFIGEISTEGRDEKIKTEKLQQAGNWYSNFLFFSGFPPKCRKKFVQRQKIEFPLKWNGNKEKK